MAKTEILTVRLTPAERAGIRATAATLGIKVNNLCREAFRVYLTPEMAQLSIEAEKRDVAVVDLCRRAMWQYVSHELNRKHRAPRK